MGYKCLLVLAIKLFQQWLCFRLVPFPWANPCGLRCSCPTSALVLSFPEVTMVNGCNAIISSFSLLFLFFSCRAFFASVFRHAYLALSRSAWWKPIWESKQENLIKVLIRFKYDVITQLLVLSKTIYYIWACTLIGLRFACRCVWDCVRAVTISWMDLSPGWHGRWPLCCVHCERDFANAWSYSHV